jgi:hypothetical protein
LEPGHATIRGKLVPLAEGILPGRGFGFLYGEKLADDFGCRVEADSTGQMEFRASPEAPEDPLRRRWFLREGSRHATVLSVGDIIHEADGSVILNVSCHVGPLWASGWRCEVVKANGVWFPKTCSMTWIS